MSVATVENILAQANQLPTTEREQLITALSRKPVNNHTAENNDVAQAETGKGKIPPARIIAVNVPYNDRAKEYQWLKEHQREYIGQWVALDGDQLVAHGFNAKEVFAKADSLGIQSPFVLLVEDPDISYIGF